MSSVQDVVLYQHNLYFKTALALQRLYKCVDWKVKCIFALFGHRPGECGAYASLKGRFIPTKTNSPSHWINWLHLKTRFRG